MARSLLLPEACKDIGLGEEWTRALRDNGLDFVGKLAYAVSMPGQPLTDQMVSAFLQDVRPNALATLADLASIKRLVFEAQTFQLASLRTAVAPGDEDASKKLAPAERSERLRRQREALTGLELTGPREPAHYLYDKYAAMLDQDELQYIPPSRCVTRQQELAGEKPDKMIQLDSSKSGLIVKSAEPEREVVISSDLALQQAMTRRNLAMDLVGLATFSVLQR